MSYPSLKRDSNVRKGTDRRMSDDLGGLRDRYPSLSPTDVGLTGETVRTSGCSPSDNRDSSVTVSVTLITECSVIKFLLKERDQ